MQNVWTSGKFIKTLALPAKISLYIPMYIASGMEVILWRRPIPYIFKS